jgi:hypothetical protein
MTQALLSLDYRSIQNRINYKRKKYDVGRRPQDYSFIHHGINHKHKKYDTGPTVPMIRG